MDVALDTGTLMRDKAGGEASRVCASFSAWAPLARTAFLVPSEHSMVHVISRLSTTSWGEIKLCIHSGGGTVLIVSIKYPQE